MALKILAVKLRAIGDTVIWTSALESLPNAEIHTLSYASNSAILKGLPSVQVRHELSTKSNFELLRTLWELRQEKFDWLLGFHATTSLCRFAHVAGAQRMALHHHSRAESPRGSVLIPHAGELEDAIARDHRVLEAMGVTSAKAPTKIALTPEELGKAEVEMRGAITKAGGNPNLPRHLFLPGAGHHLRRLPVAQWLPYARRIKSGGLREPVVLADAALSGELNLPHLCTEAGLPLLDQGSLRQFCARVARGERALANDSGPGHIAVALGVQTTFAFGPGCVGDWHPYDRAKHPVLRVPVPCRLEGPRDREEFQYCTVDVCGHHRCLRQIEIKN